MDVGGFFSDFGAVRTVSVRAGTNITFDFKVTSQPWFTCEQCNSELQSEGKKVRLMLCVHCAKRCHDGADSASFLAFSELQLCESGVVVVSRGRERVYVSRESDNVRSTQVTAGSSICARRRWPACASNAATVS